MTDKLPRVAVVLVHYEDYALGHFEHCYQDLLSQSFPKDLFTVFVVSNGASKESDDFVQALSPGARHLRNGNNEGWAHANNLAITIALKENYEYIVLLNMDMQLDRNWLLHLFRAAEEQASLHIIQSKIMLHGTTRINSMGNRTHFLGYGYCMGFGKEPRDYKEDATIDFASGASMLVRSEVFRRIGLFDEKYFMYYDDMEFCWRARLAGFFVSLEPRSVCYHKYDFSGKINFLYHFEKNRLLTLFTLLKKRSLLLIALPLITAQVVSSLYFICIGYSRQICALYAFFCKRKTWDHIYSKRMKMRSLRQRSDAAIVKNFSPYIMFPAIQHNMGIKISNILLSFYWKALAIFICW